MWRWTYGVPTSCTLGPRFLTGQWDSWTPGLDTQSDCSITDLALRRETYLHIGINSTVQAETSFGLRLDPGDLFFTGSGNLPLFGSHIYLRGVNFHNFSDPTGGGNLPPKLQTDLDLISLTTGVGSLLCFSGQTGSGNLPLVTQDIDADGFSDPDGYRTMRLFHFGVGSHQFSGLTGSGNLPLMQYRHAEPRRLNIGVGSLFIFLA